MDAINNLSVISVTGSNDVMATFVHINETDQNIIASTMEVYNFNELIILE